MKRGLTMLQRRSPVILHAVAAIWLLGCNEPMTEPPKNLAAYEQMPKSGPQSYPKELILKLNLTRALDPDLAPAERAESMKLVAQLGSEDPEVVSELAAVLTEKGDKPEFQQLQQTVLGFLLKKGDPSVSAHVARALPELLKGPLRYTVLDWLSRNGGDPGVLAALVRGWAEEPSHTGPNEWQFRQVVERVTGKGWEQSLIDGINAPKFEARGLALEILSRRIPPAGLRQQIQAAKAQSNDFRALQAFLNGFDYLPGTRREFLAVTYLNATQWQILPDAARLYREWQNAHKYTFNVRDFHLISRLARDPLRKDLNISRAHLVVELEQALNAREHVHHLRSAPGALDDYIDRFAFQKDVLTHADLWNLYLLNGMLSRERVQQALRIMARQDRTDKRTAWGGLMFYQNGEAEAVLYKASPEYGENDLLYVPSSDAVTHGLDALCRFHARFERPDNASRAGPNEADLRDAKLNNYYGLVLTSINEDAFCAHYYNPSGKVVSLGAFPLRK
jgi:hypothetical protein